MTAPNPPAPSAAPPASALLDHGTIVQIMSGILLGMFLSALEQAIVAPALPTIGRSLGNVESLSWVVSAYLLTYTAATPLFGKLSDIYGRRWMMLAALTVFILGSAACALTPNMPALIVARGLQGIGGGGILPIAHTVIGDMVAPRERARYQGYTSVMFVIASVLGPLLGGVLTDYLHWTLIFWINLPMGALALWMTDRALKKLPRHDRPHKLDMLGALLMMLAALALMLAMSWGGTRYPWASAQILGLLAGSVVLWALFGLRVATAPEPFIPLSILSQPTVCATAAAGFFSIGVFIGLTVYFPVYLQLVLGMSASGSGTALIVWLVALATGSFMAGRLMNMTPHYKRVPLGGLVLGIIMLAALAAWPSRLTLIEVSALLCVGGAGLGVMYPVTSTIVQNMVEPHRLGTATGALNFVRQLGGAIIVAGFGAIVLGGVEIGGKGLTLDMLRGGSGVAGADLVAVFRWLFAAGAGLLAVGLIAVLAVEERPLRSGREDLAREDLTREDSRPDADRIAAE